MFLKKFIGTDTLISKKRIQAICQWLLPFTCLLCSLPTKKFSNICDHCQEELPILPQCCIQCAKFLHIETSAVMPTIPCLTDVANRDGMERRGQDARSRKHGMIGMTVETEKDHQLICGACLSNPPPFHHTYALFPYESPIVHLIIHLKFHGKLHVARCLGEMFSHKIKTTWYKDKPLPDLIIPVPLHKKRLRERGFNQALEIAKPIVKSLKIPIDFTNTIRMKHTKPQSSLTKCEREENLKHAFKVLKKYPGLHLAIIDDVVTTGQTVTEICRLLKEALASRIDVWCIARRG